MDRERAVGSSGGDLSRFGPPADGSHFDVTAAEGPVVGETAEDRPRTRSGAGRAIREIVETIVLAAIIFVAVRAVVLNFKVDGPSMLPSLIDREMLLVNRNIYFHFDQNDLRNLLPGEDREGEDIVYLFHPPERGDIIVFDPPTTRPSEQPYIKRVIGLPGDVVQVRNGNVYVNDILLDEPYINAGITQCTTDRYCGPVTVPEGQVYVMGDNRNNSTDSRAFGPVPVDNIIGKAWLTYWPRQQFDLVPHYDYPELSG